MQNFDLLSLIITTVAFYFAYYTWHRINKEKRIHLLKILKTQLECLGPWMSSDRYGYGNELTENEKFAETNPTKLIYETAREPLAGTLQLESISNVPKHIIGEAYQLYYDLVRIKNIQDFKIGYINSQPLLALKLLKKLRAYKLENSSLCFCDFRKTLKEGEKEMSDTLVHWGTEIHCKVIGNKDRAARQHWEKINTWVDGELKYKFDYSFLIITFITTGFVLNLAAQLFALPIDNFYDVLLMTLLSSIITYIFNSQIKNYD